MGIELGRFVEERRRELGLTRKDVVARSGLSYPYVSQIETGDREPALKSLSALAAALEVGVSQLAELLTGDTWASNAEPPASEDPSPVASLRSGAAVGRPPSARPFAERSPSSWSTGERPSARFSSDRSASDRPSDRVDEKVLYAVERRLRDVPPLERLALLNRMVALTIDELGQQDR